MLIAPEGKTRRGSQQYKHPDRNNSAYWRCTGDFLVLWQRVSSHNFQPGGTTRRKKMHFIVRQLQGHAAAQSRQHAVVLRHDTRWGRVPARHYYIVWRPERISVVSPEFLPGAGVGSLESLFQVTVGSYSVWFNLTTMIIPAIHYYYQGFWNEWIKPVNTE